MSITTQEIKLDHRLCETKTMKALVFRGPDQISIEEVPIPKPGLAKPSFALLSLRSAAPTSTFSKANIPSSPASPSVTSRLE